MKLSLFLGRISGIKIFIHWTFILLIGWIAFMDFSQGKNINETIWTVTFYLTLFLCVFLHELGHALAAKKYHINTKDITILPIGGLARLERIPEIPRQELWVAVAGPLVNVAIAVILYLPVVLGLSDSQEYSIVSVTRDNFISMVLYANIILVLFNLIPAFPMDGGRILRALLAMKMNRAKATKIATGIGQVLAVGFVLLGIFNGNFMLTIIGFFIYLGARAESGYTQTSSSLQGYTVKDVLMTDFKVLHKQQPLVDAARLLLDGQTKDFLVIEDGQVAGTLSRSEMIKGLSSRGGHIPVENVMNTEVNFLKADASLESIFPLSQQKDKAFFPVLDENDKLIGVVDSENIIEFIMIREAINKNNAG